MGRYVYAVWDDEEDAPMGAVYMDEHEARERARYESKYGLWAYARDFSVRRRPEHPDWEAF